MTAVVSIESRLAGMGKDARIAALRRSVSALEGRGDGSVSGLSRSIDSSGQVISPPSGLSEVLGGGVVRGAVSTVDTAGAVVSAIIAAATQASLQVAVVGLPQCGMLSVLEHGGDISRIIVVEQPGESPLEVVGLLADGADLVVVSLPQTPSPSLARPLMSRLRKSECALLFVGNNWPGARMRITSAVVAVHGLEIGRGRIRGVEYSVSAQVSGRPWRHARWSVGEVERLGVPDAQVVPLQRAQ